MSALPPLATELMRRNELPLYAMNGLMQRSKIYHSITSPTR
jgi:hypothetical protein